LFLRSSRPWCTLCTLQLLVRRRTHRARLPRKLSRGRSPRRHWSGGLQAGASRVPVLLRHFLPPLLTTHPLSLPHSKATANAQRLWWAFARAWGLRAEILARAPCGPQHAACLPFLAQLRNLPQTYLDCPCRCPISEPRSLGLTVFGSYVGPLHTLTVRARTWSF